MPVGVEDELLLMRGDGRSKKEREKESCCQTAGIKQVQYLLSPGIDR